MRYPIYVPSRGRYENCLTAKFLIKDETPFHLVVEPHEYDEYARRFGAKRVIVLPFENVGVEQLVKVRNWIWEHSLERGFNRHWQIDDNIRSVQRRYKGKRINCNSNAALSVCEDFVDRYENVAVAGLNYRGFLATGMKVPPFRLNAHVYSCTLIKNDLDLRYRGPRNEDVDLCLQVLASGWCTIQFQIFIIVKMKTMVMKGGNSHIYEDDGRLKMSKVLERNWPGVVSVKRRFDRPHHKIAHEWKRFDTPLIRRTDIDWDNLEPNEYGLKLRQIKAVKSKELQQFVKENVHGGK